jgi:hypothetical protein
VLGCLVTGSVMLPGLHRGADPANIGAVDTMQAAEPERAWLLEEMATHLRGRFVLLSGDYHVSFLGEVCLEGERVGAAVIAPPFYAPVVYANARPEDLWLDERIATGAGTVSVRALEGMQARVGSGYGMLDFVPGPSGWTVRLGGELLDFERCGRWTQVAWPGLHLPAGQPAPRAPASDAAPVSAATASGELPGAAPASDGARSTDWEPPVKTP